jgi:KRAB domain-containing zinc finger protein
MFQLICHNILFLAETFKISCPECPTDDSKILFDDRMAFELHYKKSHKAQVKFGCVSCDYNSKKFNLLKNHSKKHIVRKYECNECSKTYSQKSELNHHKTNDHKLKICRKCNLEFHDLEAYLEHKATHNIVQPKSKTAAAPLECPDCKKVLMTQGGLFTHRKMHLEKPKFKCQTCEKSFFQKVNLINHTKTHNIQNKSFSCEQCDKKFFEKSHLQRHQNFHSVSRDYECSGQFI